jgi:hypothetical protein
VPFARDQYPEFEHAGSAPRKLGLALAFVIAGASGIAVFMADSDPGPDPMNAMALAPVEALSSAINAISAETTKTPVAEPAFVKTVPKVGGSNPPCQKETTAENLSGDCALGKAHKPRPVAVNERPIAAAPIGDRNGPALLPSEPAIPVAATPDGRNGSAKTADVEPASEAAPASAVVEFPTPAASVKKAQTHSSHVHRRERNAYSRPSRYSYHNYNQGGYARLW